MFDLDGTLLDTRGDLAFCVNRLFSNHGLSSLSKEACAAFMGWGIREFIRRSFLSVTGRELSEADLTLYYKEFIADYAEHPAPATAAYPGVTEGLQLLRDKGIYCAVATNKAHSIAEKVVALRLGGLIRDCQGPVGGNGEEGVPSKPHPKLVSCLIKRSGLKHSDFLLIGDSSVDMETAFQSGLPFGAVSWGYGNPETMDPHRVQWVFPQFEAIVDLFSVKKHKSNFVL